MRRRLRERPADLITLDIKLPGRDGLALMRDLRTLSDIPIVIVSALDDAPDGIIALEMGADDYVTKPLHSPRAGFPALDAASRRCFLGRTGAVRPIGRRTTESRLGASRLTVCHR
jgi:DNA-binding response OmpR family regulator